MSLLADERRREIDYRQLDLHRWPLFTHAMKNADLAHSFKVEWVSGNSMSLDSDSFNHNFTQIVRTAFTPGDAPEVHEAWALRDHLDTIEDILLNGRRFYGSRELRPGIKFPHHTCGGVRELLGREPNVADRIELLWLRPTCVLELRQAPEDPEAKSELISEFSLRVSPVRTLLT